MAPLPTRALSTALLRAGLAAAVLAGGTVAVVEVAAQPGPSSSPVISISRAPDGGVLHRRLPPRSGPGEERPVFVYDPQTEGGVPREVHRDGEVIEAPEGTLDADAGEAVYSESGVFPSSQDPGEAESTSPSPMDPAAEAGDPTVAAGDPSGEPPAAPGPGASEAPLDDPLAEAAGTDPRVGMGDVARADMRTEREGTLEYHTVFDPSVVPFKRNRALNRIDERYQIVLERGPLREIRPVGNQVGPGREVFFANILLRGEPGRAVPIPSVAPDSRILSYEATPATDLTFFKDDADNYYVVPNVVPKGNGRLRLVVVVDAPGSYFGRPLPRGVTVRDVPRPLRPKVPLEVKREARAVAEALGLGRSQAYHELVGGLVTHFRSFEPGEPPPEAENAYTALALGKRGVCRHRTYALVITAQGLGIPARYVFNEAHVFAELWVPGPDPGWLRVDLGGGADRLLVHAGDGKIRHEPRARDPFQQPEPYADQLDQGRTAGATTVEGLPPTTHSRRETAEAPGGTSTSGPGGEVAESASGAAAAAAAATEALEALVITRATAPGEEQIPTQVTLQIADALVFRGDEIEVSGQVVAAPGQPVAEGTVQILVLDRNGGEALAVLGARNLDAGGTFGGRLRLDKSLAPGSYEVVAEFMGSGRYAPAVSD